MEKLKIFYELGFLKLKFDGEKFQKSNRLYIRSYLIWIFTILAPLKCFLGPIYEQKDIKQLYIGNINNYFDSEIAKYYIGIGGKFKKVKDDSFLKLNF